MSDDIRSINEPDTPTDPLQMPSINEPHVTEQTPPAEPEGPEPKQTPDEPEAS
jgi:hypothetical protein